MRGYTHTVDNNRKKIYARVFEHLQKKTVSYTYLQETKKIRNNQFRVGSGIGICIVNISTCISSMVSVLVIKTFGTCLHIFQNCHFQQKCLLENNS